MNSLNINTRTAELAAIGAIIKAFFDKVEELQSDDVLTSIVAEIDELSQSMTTAVNQDKVRSELGQADATRDAAVRSLGALIESYTVIPFAEKQAAAQVLKEVFDRFGTRIVRLSYSEASTNIDALLDDLSDEGLAESIALLEGMADAIDALRSSQTAYDEVYAAYTNARTHKAASATSYRKPMLKAINTKLVPYLTVAALVCPDKYENFADNVEDTIASTNITVRKRKRKTVAASESENEAETTD